MNKLCLFFCIIIFLIVGCSQKKSHYHNYIGVIVNEDAYETLTVRHPYQNETIILLPEKFRFINCPKIPKDLLFMYSKEKKYSIFSFEGKPTFYQGQEVDFAVSFRTK